MRSFRVETKGKIAILSRKSKVASSNNPMNTPTPHNVTTPSETIDWSNLAQLLPIYDALAECRRVPAGSEEAAFAAALRHQNATSDFHVDIYRRYQAWIAAPQATPSKQRQTLFRRLQLAFLRLVAYRANKATAGRLAQKFSENTPPITFSTAAVSAQILPNASDVNVFLKHLTEAYADLGRYAFGADLQKDLSAIAQRQRIAGKVEVTFEAVERAVATELNDPLAAVYSAWELVQGITDPRSKICTRTAFDAYMEVFSAAKVPTAWPIAALHIPTEDTLSATVSGFGKILNWSPKQSVLFYRRIKGLELTTVATANPVGLQVLLGLAAHRLLATDTALATHEVTPLLATPRNASIWAGQIGGIHSVLLAHRAGTDTNFDALSRYLVASARR